MNKKREKWLFLIAVATTVAASAIAKADIVALWEFDFSGRDSLGKNHGILKGNPAWAKGHFGGALELDGVDDYVVLGAGDELNFGSDTDFSVSLWVRTYGWPEDAAIIGNKNWNSGASVGWITAGHPSGSGSWQWNYCGAKGTRVDWDPSDVKISDNVWHYFCVTHDRDGYAKFYFDGVFKGREDISDSTGTIDARYPTVLGQDGREMYGVFFKGLIDDVAIFNHALEPEEVNQLYKQGGSSFMPKDYAVRLVEEAEAMAKEIEPEKAIASLEKKIAEYEKWQLRNPNDVKSYERLLSSDIYFLLARAKEAANVPTQDVTAAYKHALSRPHRPSDYIPAALLWLFGEIPADDYIKVVKECIRNSSNLFYGIWHIVKYFEAVGNWPAFTLFLDGVFSEVDDTGSCMRVVVKGLEDGGSWANKFEEYCRSKPELMEHLFREHVREHEEMANRYISKENFQKAVQIYVDLISQCGRYQKKATTYELKLCECLFNNGQYDSVVHELNRFIENNKAANRVLTSEAILLKGQAYVHLGDIDQATDTFLTLMVEYPQAKEAPEANFFAGYCYMLQGKFKEATEAFNLVVQDYPESSYFGKARSYLGRIKNMTE